MTFNGFKEECKAFCKIYNSKPESDRIKRKIFSKNTDIKSSNFGLLYYEIGKSFKIEEKTLIDFSKFIDFLANLCHAADDIVDSQLSRERVVEILQLFPTLYDDMNGFLNNLGLDYRVIHKGFNKGIKLFEEEELTKRKPITLKEVKHMIEIGSPDLEMYTNLFCALVKDNKIKKFMEHYAALDLILDHIADLEKDFENKSFNPIYLYLKNRAPKDSEKLPPHLTKNKGLESILKTAYEYGNVAKQSLGNGSVLELLKFYLNGEIEGLRLFEKYNFLEGFPDKQRIKYLILKPHPWELYTYKEVFP